MSLQRSTLGKRLGLMSVGASARHWIRRHRHRYSAVDDRDGDSDKPATKLFDAAGFASQTDGVFGVITVSSTSDGY